NGSSGTQVTLPEFNTSLGTLTDITLTLKSSISTEVDVINLTNTAQRFTNASATAPLTITGPDATSITATAIATVASGMAHAGPFVITHFAPVSQTALTKVHVPNENFGSYEGSGTSLLTFIVNTDNAVYSGTAARSGALAFSGSECILGTV